MLSVAWSAAVVWSMAAGVTPWPSHAPAITTQQSATTVGEACGMTIPAPARLPPAGSKPIVLALLLCFEAQGGQSLIDPQTYLYYVQVRPSEPSRDVWVGYDEDTEARLRTDFQRLWRTGFLDDLTIEAQEVTLANGVAGKVILFRMEERQRIRVVDFEGNVRLDRSPIDERLRDRNIELRLESFVDASQLKRAATAVRELYAEKGYQFAEVTPQIRPAVGGPKLVNVTFVVSEGPQVAIRDVEFVGNRAIDDHQLVGAMKTNRAAGLLSFIKGTGTYQTDKFAEDAEAVAAFYRQRGYASVQVGQPELRPLEDTRDGTTRWIQLRIPITEGPQYRIGTVEVEGNEKVPSAALATMFRIKAGDIYNEAAIRKGLERAREVYGAGGYYEFTAYPDLQPRPDARGADGRPLIDVTLKIAEGLQYFVNRITFLGNTHTRDDVLRRELGLFEAGVFNTEALKHSVRRLNQLGYFKTLDDNAVSIEKTAERSDRVDVTLRVEEQNRNQLSFGAGTSQYEGLYGSASFTTSNFLGRGESLTIALQRGARSSNYQLSFSEPYLFGRPITAGGSAFSRKLDYRLMSNEIDYSEVRTGLNVTGGHAVGRFARLYATYGYEVIDTASSLELEQLLAASNGSTGLFLTEEGRHIQSSVSPSYVYNTVDNPYAPRSGMRLTATYQYSGGWLGGTTNFARPDLEAVYYRPVTRRTALGVRAQAGWLWRYQRTALPYYLRYFMGGETQIRGTNIRTVGPMNENDVPLGGSKFVLFNAEYYVDLLPQVRALLFHDAGQAFTEREAIDLRQLRTSSGAELRVVLPMIGVPFRLIYAWNVYRDTFQPAKTFKFAVGTTF
jgi:outer membrane protein insertion porin family